VNLDPYDWETFIENVLLIFEDKNLFFFYNRLTLLLPCKKSITYAWLGNEFPFYNTVQMLSSYSLFKPQNKTFIFECYHSKMISLSSIPFFFYLHDKTLRFCHEILSSDVTQIMMCHKIHCSPFVLFAQNFWFKMRFVCSHILFGVTLRLVDPLQPTVLALLRITYESQVSSGFISSTFNEQALLFLSLTLEIE
jgi:hypothetical protein